MSATPGTPDRTRRRILAGAACASLLAAPFVRAQKARVAHVVLAGAMPKTGSDSVRATLAKAGFVEGRNLRIEQVQILHAPPDLAEARARQVVASRPDVIFIGSGPETVLLQHLTRDIPIVFHNCKFDPVRGGLIASAARPGANITGTYDDYLPLIVKRWALFREVLPGLRRGAWLGLARSFEAPRWKHREAAEAYAKGFLWQEREANAIAQRELGIRIAEIVVPGDPTEEQLIAAVRPERPEALRISTNQLKEDGPFDRFLISDRILSELVVRVGPNPREAWDAALVMMVKVLRGARPADMPAFQSTRYTVKVNPKLAKAMGIALPQSVLLQAGVIEE